MTAPSYLRAVDTASSGEIDRLAEKARKRGKSGDPPATDNRVEVIVKKGRSDQTTDAAEAALIASGQPIYHRGDLLCRLVNGVETPGIRRDPQAPILVPATAPMLLEAIEASARFTTMRKLRDHALEPITIPCPPAIPNILLSRIGRWRVPYVRAVSAVPLLRDDATVCYEGYDPHHRVLVADCADWPRIPADPTEAEVSAGMVHVEALLAGFPFVRKVDHAVTLSAMMTALLRSSLPSAPGHGFDASAPGSGKSKLVDLVAGIATGRAAAAITWTNRPEEDGKRVGAALLAGDAVINLDNVEAPIRSPELCSILTQSSVAVRVLGASHQPHLSTAVTVLANGNNLTIQGDLTRRFLICRIDPGCERPELRQFSFDPVVYAREHRRELVTALLTLAQWGRRQAVNAAPLGSFEEWSRRVRNPIIAYCGADPAACLDQLAEADPERETASCLLAAWSRAFGNRPITAAEAIRRATEDHGGDADLRDALDAVAGGPGGIAPKRLARALQRLRDRLLRGLVLRRGQRELRSNTTTWFVEVVP